MRKSVYLPLPAQTTAVVEQAREAAMLPDASSLDCGPFTTLLKRPRYAGNTRVFAPGMPAWSPQTRETRSAPWFDLHGFGRRSIRSEKIILLAATVIIGQSTIIMIALALLLLKNRV